jgi:hypothetical protein
MPEAGVARPETPQERVPTEGPDVEIIYDVQRIIIIDKIKMEDGRVEEHRPESQGEAHQEFCGIILEGHNASLTEALEH